MNTKTIQPITVPSEQWSTYLAEKAKLSAAKRKVESFQTAWGVKTGEEYASEYSLTDNETIEIPVVNGNGLHVGKLTVFHKDGFTVSPTWAKRLS